MQEGKMKPGDYRTLASLYGICPAVNKQFKPPDFLEHSFIGKVKSYFRSLPKVL
jgi:hypothetical protein